MTPVLTVSAPPKATAGQTCENISLTTLWDYVIRTQSLPERLDVDALFETIHERLKSPEWEVRQNALRVLGDVIPLLPADALDAQMMLVREDLVTNLGHLGPAVRKGAVDTLKTYLNHSAIPNAITRDLVERGVEKYSEYKTPTNVVLGVILCLPYVLNDKLNDTTVNYIIHKLLDKIVLVMHQETVLRALLRIRDHIGAAKFDAALSTHDSYNSARDLELLCEVYDLQMHHLPRVGSFAVAKTEDLSDSENGPPPNFDLDKVILETEIHLDSGSSITMKIHEENSPSDALGAQCSRFNSRTFKVLPDVSIEEHYGSARQTPRRVHFGGEIVKLRTPDSDSNLEDNEATISIISDDNGEKPVIEIQYVESEMKTTIRTTRSLIPIPIKHTQSAPASPVGQPTKPTTRTLKHSKEYKSSPSLSHTVSPTWGKSRIPRRLNTQIKRNVETKILINIKEPSIPNRQAEGNKDISRMDLGLGSSSMPMNEKAADDQRDSKVAKSKKAKGNNLSIPTIIARRNSHEDIKSPLPIHNEIELFHNLTRTPSPKQTPSSDSPAIPSINQPPTDFQDNGQVVVPVEITATPNHSFDYPKQGCQEAVPEKEVAKPARDLAFHIYTSVETHSEDGLRDSPIPINNSGECLTCSSSGSENGVCLESLENAHFENGIFEDLQNMNDIKARQKGLNELVRVMHTPSVLDSLQDRLPALLCILFSALQHTTLQNAADNALFLLFSNMKQEVLQTRLQQICLQLAKLGSPSSIRLANILMRRIPPKLVVDQLLGDAIIGAKSAKVREGALQIVMAVSRLYPSTDLDIPKPLKVVIRTLTDRKKRVRQSALETLAALAQLSGNSVVLEAAEDVTADMESAERQQVLQVIRARLSRKQLPTVLMNGSVQYTAPLGDSEIEWVSKGYSTSSSPGTTPGEETVSQSLSSEESNNAEEVAKGTRVSTACNTLQESARRRFVENYSPRASTAELQNKKINYWQANARNQSIDYQVPSGEDGESDWSGSSREEPFEEQNGSRTQVWAIDPTAFTTMGSGKLSPANGTLRQVYVLQNRSDVKGTLTKPERRKDTEVTPPLIQRQTNRHSSRGRSFSPPAPSSRSFAPFPDKAYSNYAASSHHMAGRFISGGHYERDVPKAEPEVMRKSFSSEQLTRMQGFRNENTFSSGSSSSSSTTRHGHWRDWRSGIPVPIFDGKVKLRTRQTGKNLNSKGPMTIPYYPTVKSPCLDDTPKRTNSSNGERSQFSSGSESSGYFTPPPEAHERRVSLDVRTPQQTTPSTTPQSERFVRIETPWKLDSDHDSYDDEQVADGPSQSTSKTEGNQSELRASSSLSSRHFLEHPLRKNDATNSLDLSKATFDALDGVPAHIDVQIATHIRKNVNSAPALNDLEFDEPTVVHDSLPDACPPLYATSSPTKRSPTKGKLVELRRKSSRYGEAENGNGDRPFARPREALHEVSAQLESGEWETTMKGLQGLVALIRHHKDVVEGQMHAVCILLGKHVRNLRSQVARKACYAAGELFRTSKRPLEMELDELATPLLHRTADTNKFLRGDANAALDEMCANLSVPKLVSVITFRGCCHQNSVVRSAATRLLCKIVQRLGAEKVFQLPKDTRDKILLTGAKALTEGSLETRQHAKMLLGMLAEHCTFQKAMAEAVPGSVLRHIDKTIKILAR